MITLSESRDQQSQLGQVRDCTADAGVFVVTADAGVFVVNFASRCLRRRMVCHKSSDPAWLLKP